MPKKTTTKKTVTPAWSDPLGIPGVCFSLADQISGKVRQKQYAKQRMTRGWDDTETWSLDTTIADFILPRLKRFREVQHGYPHGETAESWNVKLDAMIRAFTLVSTTFEVDDSTPKQIAKNFREQKKGLKIFSEYLGCLWW